MAELNVSRTSIGGLFNLDVNPNTRGKRFIVPEYQRPYRWEKDTCDVLWNDLVNFFNEHKADDKEYFLGSIVTCADASNPTYIDIIDGQQRITSLMLLLRAFYYKLELAKQDTPDDDEVDGLMRSVAPCIWNVHPLSQKVTDITATHIYSLVATDDDNEEFQHILQTGKTTSENDSFYARNYRNFLDKCNEYAANSLTGWKEFCNFIIQRCIVLPIECKDLDAALTIFGTLNNRGLPLSDSDIFKAELYKLQTTPDEKSAFTANWKQLEQTVEQGGFSVDDLFRYYMHIDRASRGDVTKEIGLRRFYAGDDSKFKIFKQKDFVRNLMDLANFWASVYNYEDDYCDDEAKKYIQCLSYYPNDYWKHPISVFYQVTKDKKAEEFKKLFTPYLRRLLSFVFVKFIENPTVNAIKDSMFAFYVATYKTGTFQLDNYRFPETLEQDISRFAISRITKALLLLHAYLFDSKQERITGRLNIEHILPQKWQDTNYNGWSKQDAAKYIEMFGNKIILGKRLNIQAGNGYFGKKKSEYYCKSNILEVVALSQYPHNDWLKEDIEQREQDFISRLVTFFKQNLTPASTDEIIAEENVLHLQHIQDEYRIIHQVYESGKELYSLASHELDMAQTTLTHKVFTDITICDEHLDTLLQHITKAKLLSGTCEINKKYQSNIETFLTK